MRNVICLFLAWILVACGSARRSEPLVGTLEPTGSAARGKVVFMEHCHECHPGGEAGLGPALNNKPLPGLAVKAQIRMGVGAMPGFSDSLSDSEMWQLAQLLVSADRLPPAVQTILKK